jgi:hypothetical protein
MANPTPYTRESEIGLGPYRQALPQLDGEVWLTDGGIETRPTYQLRASIWILGAEGIRIVGGVE